MFAKLYETELGQILVKQDEGDKGAQISIFFEPEGLGVCSIDMNWENDTNEIQWEKSDEAFKTMTEEKVTEIIRVTLAKFCL
jgi:hypothetical protein